MTIKHFLLAALLAIGLFAQIVQAQSTPPTDKPPHPQTGLFYAGEVESGWGMQITRKANTGFVTIYAYEPSGAPVWYVISDCQFVGNNCAGEIYRVDNATPLTQVWNGANRKVSKVGDGVIVYSDNNNARFTFTIDNKAGTKLVTRQLFGDNTPSQSHNVTDLWWNANQSGWGASITQRNSVIFAAFYTYEPSGAPIWYVASDCRIPTQVLTGVGASPMSCTGDLFQVVGGTPLTQPWNGSARAITRVGVVSLNFNSSSPNLAPDSAVMTYIINGVSSSRNITRQPYGVEQAAGVCGLSNAVAYQQKMTHIGGAASSCATVMRVGQYVETWKPLNPYFGLDNILGVDGRWGANLENGNVVIMATNEMAICTFGGTAMCNLSRAIYSIPAIHGGGTCITAIFADTGRGYDSDRIGSQCFGTAAGFTTAFDYAVATPVSAPIQGLILKDSRGGLCYVSNAAGGTLITCPR